MLEAPQLLPKINSTMRKARGNLNQLTGYFHVENSLGDDVPRFTTAKSRAYCAMMFEEAEAAGLEIAFWHFHPCGFGMLLLKKASTNHSSGKEGQPSGFIKTLKQRITAHHNRESQHSGGIWKDRAKLFHIPDTLDDRIEVAAYITARPEIESGDDSIDWPSTIHEARTGRKFARDALTHLFGKKRFSPALIDRILEKRDSIRRDAAEPLKITGRGRNPEWRPTCEQGGNANALAKPPAPGNYRTARQRAKQQFFAMLARYEAFCRKTGHDRIPRGYSGEDRLRAWAARRRGAFRRGRMPQWQLDALAGTTVLEPIISSETPAPPSTAWLRHYKALQNFHRQHGHARVKRTDPDNKTLANWVWTQRAEARKGKLHPEKRQLLETLGFDWNPRKVRKTTKT